MSKRSIITTSNNLKVIRNSYISLRFNIYIVSDAMRRESAMAEDYWHDIFKQNKHDGVEVILQNIEQK
jgi:hypothetical protein